MRKIVLSLYMLAAIGVGAQSLLGTWVSTEPILVNLKFSLTFSDEGYLIDCTLGQTIGTFIQGPDKIYFTPTKIGINSGDVGKNDVWNYRFSDDDTFVLSSGALSVRLFRKN